MYQHVSYLDDVVGGPSFCNGFAFDGALRSVTFRLLISTFEAESLIQASQHKYTLPNSDIGSGRF